MPDFFISLPFFDYAACSAVKTWCSRVLKKNTCWTGATSRISTLPNRIYWEKQMKQTFIRSTVAGTLPYWDRFAV